MISFDTEQIKKIANAIEKQGFIILPSAIPNKMLVSLEAQIKSLNEADLKMAGIGRGNAEQNNQEIRRDKIYWLSKQNSVDYEFIILMESMRAELNQSLYLGLFDYESHYAIYQEGDFYKQHIDALKGKSNRVLSTILYLNEKWNTEDGGELIIYSEDKKTILETVIPNAGTMVIFLSEQFPHEVLAAKKIRYSIAGWFRVNASDSQNIDTIS